MGFGDKIHIYLIRSKTDSPFIFLPSSFVVSDLFSSSIIALEIYTSICKLHIHSPKGLAYLRPLM